MAAHDLFPPIQAYETGLLAVDNLHTIYWEQSGNPKGRPVLFVHGGPGAGASPDHRRFFDPAAYRIVIFDQRGAGRSTPLGETRANTTQHLIADMELLRERLGIDRWHLFGGSWGSTLALAYAQAHPERVSALLLRGIFLCQKGEVDWFLYGMRTFFPEVWDRFSGFVPKAERNDLLDAYYRRLMDPDPSVHMPAARSWSTYEGACSTLMPSPETVAAFGEDGMALGLARIEAHYFINKIFLPEGALLERAGLLKDLPGAIVQGRYDTVCPPTTAYALHRAWPAASFRIVSDAGHSAMEPGIRRALVEATERFKTYT